MLKIINSHLLAAFIGSLLIACSEKEESLVIPPNVLTEARFVKVLADFCLAEGAANMNIKGIPVQKIDSVYAFDPLKENNVRPSQYDSTLQFYTAHPELYKKVYENVLINLTELQTKKYFVQKDSLRRK